METTRNAARDKGDKFYFNGTQCKHGHTAKRRVSNGHCVDCDAVHARQRSDYDDWLDKPDGELPKTRAEAIKLNASHYFTGAPCKHGHLSRRSTNSRLCMECGKKFRAGYYGKNKAKVNEQRRQHRLDNLEEYSRRDAERYRRESEYRKERERKFRTENPDKVCEMSALKRAGKADRTPAWSDRVKIKKIYKRKQYMQTRDNITYHVDHVIPLFGKLVSGLHVHNNLQILTAEENQRKHSKFEIE